MAASLYASRRRAGRFRLQHTINPPAAQVRAEGRPSVRAHADGSCRKCAVRLNKSARHIDFPARICYINLRRNPQIISRPGGGSRYMHGARSCANTFLYAGIAQLVEQLICNQQVGGSSPSASSKKQDPSFDGSCFFAVGARTYGHGLPKRPGIFPGLLPFVVVSQAACAAAACLQGAACRSRRCGLGVQVRLPAP